MLEKSGIQNVYNCVYKRSVKSSIPFLTIVWKGSCMGGAAAIFCRSMELETEAISILGFEMYISRRLPVRFADSGKTTR